MKKFVGKPYAGKPHVRFEEGVGKAFDLPILLYCILCGSLCNTFFLEDYRLTSYLLQFGFESHGCTNKFTGILKTTGNY
jgi:hypothetical protein